MKQIYSLLILILTHSAIAGVVPPGEHPAQGFLDPQTQKLFQAISDGNIDQVTTLLDQGADIEGRLGLDGRGRLVVGTKSWKEYTPLLLAAHLRQYGIVEILLERGADVHARDKDANQVLHIAIQKGGEVPLIQTIINHGANINAMDEFERTPLDLAIDRDRIEVVNLLTRNGAIVNERLFPRMLYDGMETDDVENLCRYADLYLCAGASRRGAELDFREMHYNFDYDVEEDELPGLAPFLNYLTRWHPKEWEPDNHHQYPQAWGRGVKTWLGVAKRLRIPKEIALLITSFIMTPGGHISDKFEHKYNNDPARAIDQAVYLLDLQKIQQVIIQLKTLREIDLDYLFWARVMNHESCITCGNQMKEIANTLFAGGIRIKAKHWREFVTFNELRLPRLKELMIYAKDINELFQSKLYVNGNPVCVWTTPLHALVEAVEAGETTLEAAKELLEAAHLQGANWGLIDYSGNTPENAARQIGQEELADFIHELQNRRNPEAPMEENRGKGKEEEVPVDEVEDDENAPEFDLEGMDLDSDEVDLDLGLDTQIRQLFDLGWKL